MERSRDLQQQQAGHAVAGTRPWRAAGARRLPQRRRQRESPVASRGRPLFASSDLAAPPAWGVVARRLPEIYGRGSLHDYALRRLTNTARHRAGRPAAVQFAPPSLAPFNGGLTREVSTVCSSCA